MKTKEILLILFLLVCLIFVVNEVKADWLANGACERSTTCTISRQLVNDTNGTIISNANCTIDIFSYLNSSIILVNDGQMSNISGNGIYTYDIRYDNNGYYPSTMSCTLISSIDAADTSFSVIDREADKKLITFPILYILLIGGWGILIFAVIRQDINIATLASFLLAIAGILILQSGIDGIINWITESFGVVNLGIALYFLGSFAIEWVTDKF